jgi:hypothetical protein
VSCQVIKANDDLTPEHHQFFLYQMLRGLKYIHSGAQLKGAILAAWLCCLWGIAAEACLAGGSAVHQQLFCASVSVVCMRLVL